MLTKVSHAREDQRPLIVERICYHGTFSLFFRYYMALSFDFECFLLCFFFLFEYILDILHLKFLVIPLLRCSVCGGVLVLVVCGHLVAVNETGFCFYRQKLVHAIAKGDGSVLGDV